MKFFKNAEIAKEYGISKPTIANWIKDTLAGKKELELVEVEGKQYIAKTQVNIKLFKEYASQGFKYRPSNSRIICEPREDFVSRLSSKQLIEIKKSLVEKSIIDVKYVYIDGGAAIWNDMYDLSAGSAATYDPYNQMNLLTLPAILQLVGDNKKINIFDIGPGNGKPIFELLESLAKKKVLNSYISIDISQDMCDLATENIKNKFGDLNVRSCVIDVENESFEEIVYEINQDYPESTNLFVLYGGTLGNFNSLERTIANIEKSMFPNDILCLNNFYPNENRFKDEKYMYESPTVDHYLFVAKSLGMKVGPEDLEYQFDYQNTTRTLYLNLPSDHTIKFSINEKEEFIDLPKGAKIKVWQHRMTDLDYIQSITKPYDLFLVLYTISSDNKFILTVYRKEPR